MISISEGRVHKDQVLFHGIEAIVVESTTSLQLEIPCPVDVVATTNVVDSEEAERVGSQSPTVILETPDA